MSSLHFSDLNITSPVSTPSFDSFFHCFAPTKSGRRFFLVFFLTPNQLEKSIDNLSGKEEQVIVRDSRLRQESQEAG